MRDKWNFLRHYRLTSGEKDEIYFNATDRNLNTMQNNKLRNCFVGIFWPTSLLFRTGERANLKESD